MGNSCRGDNLVNEGECKWGQNSRSYQKLKAEFGTCESYEGERVNGRKQGLGRERDSDGNRYVGSFSNNLRHGQGTLITGSKHTYSEEFREGSVHGRRCMIWKDNKTNKQQQMSVK